MCYTCCCYPSPAHNQPTSPLLRRPSRPSLPPLPLLKRTMVERDSKASLAGFPLCGI